MVAPDTTYAALVRAPADIGAVAALRRPIVAAVVLGAGMALSSTRHVTPSLVLSTTVTWSFVVMLQVAIALAVIPGAAAARVGRARTLDLFFASHAPWSLWVLFAAVWGAMLIGHPFKPVWLAALVPIALTPRIIAAFFRQVLGLDGRRAAVRTLVHQALTWGLFVSIFGAAVALWPRVLQVIR